MTVFSLPTESTQAYEYKVPLDGTLYRLVFRYNARDAYWYLDLYNGITGVVLRTGIKLVAEWDVLRLLQKSGRPAGRLVLVPQGSTVAEATTLDALGNDVVVTYIGAS